MKKLAFFSMLTVLVLFSGKVFSQTSFFLKSGVNVDDRYRKASDMKPFTNYFFGVGWEFPAKNDINIRVSWILNQKSDKFKDEYTWGNLYKTVSITRFEMPVMAVYRMPVGNMTASFAGGLYWGYHLKGDAYYKVYMPNRTSKEMFESINFGKDDPDWKSNDIGLGIELGLEIKNLVLGVSYNMGMNEQYHVKDIDRSVTNVYESDGTEEYLDYEIVPYKLSELSLSVI